MNKRSIRHSRVRKKVSGTELLPRLSVFRSAKYIYAQIIDDSNKKTIVAASDYKMARKQDKTEKENITPRIKSAFAVGEDIAKKAIIKKINKVVFDRGGYKFHGRVKALADGAKKGGLVF